MAERLAQSTSPYLRQYADNPVDWWPWSAEAFAHARALDRPVLLSVGYSACHWCHVMAHESFEDPATAALLNENFVSIKVDREERPDVDAVYQKALSLLGQGGGWPLTVFLTPTQRPFFGGTYFPPHGGEGRPSFTEVLRFVGDAWREERGKIDGYVQEFARGYAELREDLDEKAKGSQGAPTLGSEAAQARAWQVVKRRWDADYGGLQGAPKFPNVPLLRWLRTHLDPEARAAAQLGLAGMRRGGIHDHLGGGFARYSVDARWQVPHFEKMLYDNAQLLQVYAEASVTQDEADMVEAAGNFEVVRRCAGFMFDTLADDSGNFFAATDADSEGEEGRFFVWTRAQVDAELVPILGAEASEAFCRAYQVSEEGNFEHGRSVLWHADPQAEVAASGLAQARALLLRARSERTAPARDEKVLTGWNALAMRGLCAASLAAELGGETQLSVQWRDAAQRAFESLCATQVRGAGTGALRLFRARFEGRAHTDAFLEDYAALGSAALDLHELCAEPQAMDLAVEIAAVIARDFAREGGGFHETGASVGEDEFVLIERPESRSDGATPSGLALSMELFGRLRQSPRAQIEFEPHLQATRQRFAHIAASPFAHGALLQADRWWMPSAAHVSVLVPAGWDPSQVRADPQISALRAGVRGRTVALEYAYGSGSGSGSGSGLGLALHSGSGREPRFTLCRDGRCHPPVDDLKALWKLLD